MTTGKPKDSSHAAILAMATLFLLLAGCKRSAEIPFQPGVSHCVSKMSAKDRSEAMAWKHWKVRPMDSGYDPNREPGPGESKFNDKPGTAFCPKGMILSWDLDEVGTAPDYEDSTWA